MRNQLVSTTPTAGNRPQHESGRHRRQVDDRLVLEPQAVGDSDAHVDAHDGGQPPASQCFGQPDAESHHGCPHPGGQGHGDRPRRHRSVTLGRVQGVGCLVQAVIDKVGPAGREAEDPKGPQCQQQGMQMSEDPSRARGGQHQHVLHPLAGSGSAN